MFILDPRGRPGQFIKVVSTELEEGSMLRLTTSTGRRIAMTPEQLAAAIEDAKPRSTPRASRK